MPEEGVTPVSISLMLRPARCYSQKNGPKKRVGWSEGRESFRSKRTPVQPCGGPGGEKGGPVRLRSGEQDGPVEVLPVCQKRAQYPWPPPRGGKCPRLTVDAAGVCVPLQRIGEWAALRPFLQQEHGKAGPMGEGLHRPGGPVEEFPGGLLFRACHVHRPPLRHPGRVRSGSPRAPPACGDGKQKSHTSRAAPTRAEAKPGI